jgi:dUTPase
LPLQTDIQFEANELKKIKFKLPQHYSALLLNKSSARIKFNVSVTLGLIDVGFQNNVCMVVQNMSDKPLTLYAGTALAQLYVLKSKIPIFIEENFQKTSDEVVSDLLVTNSKPLKTNPPRFTFNKF